MARQPGTSRINRRLSSAAGKLDDHKLLLGVIVALGGAFLAYIAFVSTTGPPFQSRYQVQVQVPADAPPVKRGEAVRIGGKLAGLVSEVEVDRENGGSRVTANITKTEFRPIGSDAAARVTVQSIVYRTYLELFPGDTTDPMPNGGTIPVERVSSGVDLLEVVQLFDEEARESLRATVINGGFGLAGRGEELNAAFKDSLPLSRNLETQLEAISSDPGAIATGLRGASRVSSGLEGERRDDLSSLLRSGSAVLGEVASRPGALSATLRELRPFEDRVIETAPLAVPLLDDLAVTAADLEPAVAGLTDALPGINRLLGLGGVIESETARITAVTEPLLRSTEPLVREIYPTVAALDPLLPDVETIVDGITPYAGDIERAGEGLAEATSVRYPFGHGVGVDAPAGRVIPILTCHNNRNPFPEPGEGATDRGAC